VERNRRDQTGKTGGFIRIADTKNRNFLFAGANRMKNVLIAVAAMGLFASSQAASAEPREAISLTVSTNGYDLAQPRDVAKLRKHINAVADAVCNPSDRYGASYGPDLQCRREMLNNADGTLTQLAMVARKNKAMATNAD
jgi:UrcA family protein